MRPDPCKGWSEQNKDSCYACNEIVSAPFIRFWQLAFCVTYVTLDSFVSAGLHRYEWGVWQMLRSGASFVVVMHVSDLLFIMIYITSCISNSYRGGKM